MPTKRIAKVDCWNRQFVDEEEAIGLLNITKPIWLQFIKPKASVYLGKNYDIEQLIRIMRKCVQIDNKG